MERTDALNEFPFTFSEEATVQVLSTFLGCCIPYPSWGHKTDFK